MLHWVQKYQTLERIKRTTVSAWPAWALIIRGVNPSSVYCSILAFAERRDGIILDIPLEAPSCKTVISDNSLYGSDRELGGEKLTIVCLSGNGHFSYVARLVLFVTLQP